MTSRRMRSIGLLARDRIHSGGVEQERRRAPWA